MIKDTCLLPNAAQCCQNLGLEVPRTAPECYRLIAITINKQYKGKHEQHTKPHQNTLKILCLDRYDLRNI